MMSADEIDDTYAGDYAALEDCMARAARPREGYWRPITTLAWIVARDEQVLAGTQLYEEENHTARGAEFSAAAWMVVGCWLGKAYGRTLRDALDDLNEGLTAATIKGAIATTATTGETVDVERRQWKDCTLAHQRWGMELIPGLFDFHFPSEAVRAAFPAVTKPSPAVVRLRSKAEVEEWYKARVANWREARHPTRAEDEAAGAAFGLNTDRVRELRNKFAPTSWKSGGRPRGS